MPQRLLTPAAKRWARRLDYDWVLPEVAVGAQFSALRIPDLVAAGFGSVLDLREEATPHLAALADHGLRVLHVPVPDNFAPTDEQMWKAIGWIEGEIAQERGVFVHCRVGMGRSVLVVCGVLMARGAAPLEAFEFVKRRRQIARLSAAQWQAAQQFWRSASAAIALREAVPEAP